MPPRSVSTETTVAHWLGCPGTGPVGLGPWRLLWFPDPRYRVVGGGHEWFRPPTFDTAGAVWDFVTRRFATAAA